MKINDKNITYISRDEIYNNYVKYIEPIINYMCNVGYTIDGSDSIMEFIDNTAINGYGFIDYNGNLYIVELAEDKEQLNDYDYFVEDGDKYILIPVE